MQIQLQPHVGVNVATKLPVDLGQDRIFLDGRLVGYVGRKPAAPINLIVPNLPEAVLTAIREAVDAKYGAAERKLSQPVELPEDTEDEDPED